MRIGWMAIVLIHLLTVTVNATEFTAPSVPGDAAGLMPVETESFGEGLWKVMTSALKTLSPDVSTAAVLCICLIVLSILLSVLNLLPSGQGKAVTFAGCVAVGLLLIDRTGTMIRLGSQTVSKLSEYGKLLLPVLAAAMAAQGGVSSSSALYTGTVIFDTAVCTVISKLMIPIVYMFLAMAIVGSAMGEDILKRMRDLIKGMITWSMKTVLYIFTGYMGVTGVITGSADASALKAMKLSISGMVPVVGGILSDASEAVLVGAGLMRSAAGVYGMLAIASIWVTPFLRIGIQYLMLKLTAAVCALFGSKRMVDLICDFSTAMGFLLGMTGTVSVLHFVSAVCFLKEVG